MSKDYFKYYLRLRKGISQISLINSIMFFIFWLIAFFHYNPWDIFLNETPDYNDYVWSFLNSSHNFVPSTLALSAKIFFLWKCRTTKLKHINYFTFYYVYASLKPILLEISSSTPAAGMFLPFIELPLHFLHIKYLYQDITNSKVSILKDPLLCSLIVFDVFLEIFFHIEWITIFMDEPIHSLSSFLGLQHVSTIIYNILFLNFYTKLFEIYTAQSDTDSISTSLESNLIE